MLRLKSVHLTHLTISAPHSHFDGTYVLIPGFHPVFPRVTLLRLLLSLLYRPLVCPWRLICDGAAISPQHLHHLRRRLPPHHVRLLTNNPPRLTVRLYINTHAVCVCVCGKSGVGGCGCRRFFLRIYSYCVFSGFHISDNPLSFP